MEFLSQVDWGAIIGAVALVVVGILGKLHSNLGKAIEKLTDAVASESANGAAITPVEWQDIKKALLGKS